MRDLLASKDFNRYRVKEIGEMNTVILAFLNAGQYAEAAGAIRLAQRIIKFQSKTCENEDIKAIVAENVRRFQSNFVKEAILN